MKTKVCKKCHQRQLLRNFIYHPTMKDNRLSMCQNCKSIYDKLRRKNFPWKMILVDIKKRCNNFKNKSYKTYGGRGRKCLITENELKRLWFRDKAYEMKDPTIDRIDNNGHYEFNNCRYIERNLNIIKDKIKPILQYDLDKNFLKEWDSISNAARELKMATTDICAVAKGKRKTAFGYIWRYKL